jgi:hypothetical protein
MPPTSNGWYLSRSQHCLTGRCMGAFPGSGTVNRLVGAGGRQNLSGSGAYDGIVSGVGMNPRP